jgi:hypothetical protein
MLAKRQFDDRLHAVAAPTRAAAAADRAASPNRSSPTKKQRQGASPVAAAEAAVAAAIAARITAVATAAGAGSTSSSKYSSPNAHRTPKGRKGTPKHGEKMRKALRASSSRIQQTSEALQQAYGSPAAAGASGYDSPKADGTPASASAAAGSYASPGSGWSAGCSPGSVAGTPSRGAASSSMMAQTALAQFWVSGMPICC